MARHRVERPKWHGWRHEWFAFKLNWRNIHKPRLIPRLKAELADFWNAFLTKS
jgi:hypothetical protein